MSFPSEIQLSVESHVKSLLMTLQKKNISDNLHKCNQCEKLFSLQDLRHHYLKCEFRKGHCSRCDQVYLMTQEKEHEEKCSLQGMSEFYEILCKLCSKQIPWNEFQKHKQSCKGKQQEPPPKLDYCPLCRRQVPNLETHKLDCLEQFKTCNNCSGQIKLKDFGAHRMLCEKSQHVCPFCKILISSNEKTSHQCEAMLSQISQKEDPESSFYLFKKICPHCENSYRDESHLQQCPRLLTRSQQTRGGTKDQFKQQDQIYQSLNQQQNQQQKPQQQYKQPQEQKHLSKNEQEKQTVNSYYESQQEPPQQHQKDLEKRMMSSNSQSQQYARQQPQQQDISSQKKQERRLADTYQQSKQEQPHQQLQKQQAVQDRLPSQQEPPKQQYEQPNPKKQSEQQTMIKQPPQQRQQPFQEKQYQPEKRLDQRQLEREQNPYQKVPEFDRKEGKAFQERKQPLEESQQQVIVKQEQDRSHEKKGQLPPLSGKQKLQVQQRQQNILCRFCQFDDFSWEEIEKHQQSCEGQFTSCELCKVEIHKDRSDEHQCGKYECRYCSQQVQGQEHDELCGNQKYQCPNCGDQVKRSMRKDHQVGCTKKEQLPENQQNQLQGQMKINQYREARQVDFQEKQAEQKKPQQQQQQQQQITCKFCYKEYSAGEEKEHMAQCSERPIACDGCNNVYPFYLMSMHEEECQLLVALVAAQNSSVIPIQCPTCKKMLPQLNFEEHKRKCNEGMLIKCEYCQNRFPLQDIGAHEEKCQMAYLQDISDEEALDYKFNPNGLQLIEEKQCSMCQREYRPGETVRLLQCDHRFHTNCLNAYNVKNGKQGCPKCKK